MEGKNIFCLESDCLDLIFKNLRKEDQKSFRLTCRYFYDISCILERFKYKLVINEGNLSYADLMKISLRKFDEVLIRISHVTDEKLLLIADILDIHGFSIVTMKFSTNHPENGPGIPTQLYLNVFSKVPNLKKLSLHDEHLLPFENCDDLKIPILELSDLGLSTCEEGYSQEFYQMYKKNSIKTLKIHRDWYGLKEIVENQINVTDLTVDGLQNVPFEESFKMLTWFDEHKLENFKIRIFMDVVYEFRQAVDRFLAKHQELKTFEIIGFEFTFLPETFDVVCGMKSLVQVSIPVSANILEKLRGITKLPNIENIIFDILTDYSAHSRTLMAITSIPLPTLKKVDLRDHGHEYFNDPAIINNIAVNWPNITHLKFCNASMDENGEGVGMLNLFLEKIPKLEHISITYAAEESQGNLIFHDKSKKFQRLKEILVFRANSFDSLGDFLECAPNLTSLRFYRLEIIYTPQIIRKLLKLKDLKNLKISFDLKSRHFEGSEYDIDLLKKLCDRVLHFEISFKRNPFNEELLESLESYIVRREDTLMLAQNSGCVYNFRM